MFRNKKITAGLAIAATSLLIGGCCELFPRLPKCTDQIEIFRFTPPPIHRLCPDHIGGDREFDGHGPNVKASAKLFMNHSKSEIWVELYLHEKETRSDWTEAEGKWKRKLWTAPPGYVIVSIDSPMRSAAQYRDTDHSLDRPPVQGGNLVDQFEIMGDTRGDDVGNCTEDDAYMNVFFNEIYGKMKKG